MNGRADRHDRRPTKAWWLAVGAVTLVALGLRLFDLDWDDRQHLHPDERHWAMTADGIARSEPPPKHGTFAGPVLDWLDGQRSPANPYRGTESFVYGPAPLAVSRAVAGWLENGATTGTQPANAVVHGLDAIGVPLLDHDGNARFDDAYQVDLIGRLLAALADTATVVVVAVIGLHFGRRQGLVAAVLAATSVLAIQHAHFMGSEPYVGLAAALTVLALLRLDRGPSRRPALTSGLWLGLATGAMVAAKATGLGLALVPGALVVSLVATDRRNVDLIRLGAFVAGGIVAFRVLNPAAFDGLGLGLAQQFLDDQRSARQAANADMPPAIQWANRVPVVEGLRWLFLFTVGPGTALGGLVGSIALIRHRAAAAGRWTAAVLVGGWVVPLAFVFRDEITSGRYFMPMLPALHVCAAYGIVRLWDGALPRGATVRRAVAVGFVGLAVFWGFGFVNGVHRPDNTRIEASRWIADNVPPGSTVTSQAWDDGLPLWTAGLDPEQYPSIQFDMFGADSVEKVETVVGQLREVDYVVETSPRVWATVTRLPARFPSTTRFFEGLDDGTLGFERAATFTRSIGFGPLRVPDASAEEAFSVYDHPEVRIWKKVRDVPERELLAVLDPVAAATAVQVSPQRGSANGAMLTSGEAATNRQVGTYRDDFDVDGNPLVHLVGWVLIIELLGLATLALVAPALRVLPDAGFGLARPLGLVVVAFAVFASTTWIGLDLTRGVVIGATGAWLALGAAGARRHRQVLGQLWRTRRRLLVQTEVVTLAVLAVVVLLKAANPDIWHLYRGGEKPFELEMFTAVMRTRTLPPYDPWFAGGTLNYYYGGYFLLSVPARILRTAPPLALTLAIPVVAWLAAGAAHSAGAALASSWRAERGGRHRHGDADVRTDAQVDPTKVDVASRGSRTSRRGGLLAVLAVLVLPNSAIVPSVVDRLRGREDGPLDWWSLSRTLPDSPVVTEFPAWSFTFGDLHPHVMDLPLVLVVLTLASAWRRTLLSASTGRPVLLVAALTGLVLGAARTVNTWDLPLLVVIAAAAPVSVLVGRGRRHIQIRRSSMASATVGAAVALVAWAPYVSRTEVSDAGFELESVHSPLDGWLAHWGLLVLATVVLLLPVAAIAATTVRSPIGAGRNGRPALVLGLVLSATGLALIAVVAIDSVITAGLTAATLAALLGGACGVSALLLSRDLDLPRTTRFRRAVDATRLPGAAALAVLSLGWGYVAVIEVVSVVNDMSRMNTVFKGWFGAWTVLAAGVGAGVAQALPDRLLTFVRSSPSTRSVELAPSDEGPTTNGGAGTWRRPLLQRVVTTSSLVVVACGLLLSVAFVQLAVPARLDDRVSPGGLSLDSLRYLDGDMTVTMGEPPVTFHPRDDRGLIRWLQRNVAGIVTVAEAPGQGYTWAGRIAAHTGLPSVIGWPYHQSQQRRAYGAEVAEREADMHSLYTSGDPAVITSVLQRHRIAYLVYGTVESTLAGERERRALLDHPCLEVAFRDEERFVSEVDQRCLADQPGALPYSPLPG